MTQEQKNRLEALSRERGRRWRESATKFEKIEQELRDAINAARDAWHNEVRAIDKDIDEQIDAIFDEEV